MKRELLRQMKVGLVAAALTSLSFSLNAQAATAPVDAGLAVQLDCSPDYGAPGSQVIPNVSTLTGSCNNPGVGSAHATTTYSSIKTYLAATASADSNIDLYAAGAIYEVVKVNANDTALNGTSGVLRLTAHIDGFLSEGASIYIGADTFTDMGDYVLQESTAAVSSNNNSTLPYGWNIGPQGGLLVNEYITFYIPVIFGEERSYRIGLTSRVTGPNQFADFQHTFAFTSVEAYTGDPWWPYDPSAERVQASFLTGSGTDLVAESAANAAALSVVPEPSSYLLLIAGVMMVIPIRKLTGIKRAK